MDWTARTFLRLFLLLGGGVILILGVLSNDTLNIGIGVLAVLLGAVGLLSEWRDTSK